MVDALGPEEAGVGLRHYLYVIRRRKWIVVLVTALVVVIAAAFVFHQRSEYAAETTIVVGQGGGLVSPANAGAIQPFSATMTELIKSTVVARAVTSQLGLSLSPEQLLSKVSVSVGPQSAALRVRVVDNAPEQAQAIARQIGIAFSGLVKDRFGTTTRSGTTTSTNNPPLTATIWDPAHVIPGRVQPKPTQSLTIAALLGLVLGLLAAFLRDYFDRSLSGPESIERAFGIPVVGQIPSIDRRPTSAVERISSIGRRSIGKRPVGERQRPPRVVWDDKHGELVEAFRTLRANLQYVSVDKPLRTLLITSTGPAQGKTTVCANLTVALAQSGSSVVAVEADLRRPLLASLFRIASSSPGLTSVLVGKSELAKTIRRLDLPPLSSAIADQAKQVAILPSGPLPPNPSGMIASPQMKHLVDGLTRAFDYVLLDSPPILLIADTLELAKMADGVIVVARSAEITKDDAYELRNLAQRLGINLVGAVVTDVPIRPGYGYSQYTAKPVFDGRLKTAEARKR
jgi:capsular exopolysaccharide synthesis family protein